MASRPAEATAPALARAPRAAAPSAWALAVPGGLVFATALALAPADGGLPPRIWYPVALFLLVLALVVAALRPPAAAPRPRLVSAALLAYAGFTVWSFASIAWAAAPGDAWDGANRALAYGIALVLVASVPWTRATATAVLGLVAAGAGLLAAGVLVATATVDAPERLFLEGRLAAPIDYANATANLWLVALFPALHLVVAPHVPWPARGAALALACGLLQVAVLAQSRGAAIAVGAATLAYVVLVPRRWPALLALGLVGGLTALAWPALTAVRNADTVPLLLSSMDGARAAIAASCGAGLVLGLAAAWADTRLARAGGRPRLVRAGNVALAALAVGGVAAIGVAMGNPVDWSRDRWRDFKTQGYEEVEAGRTRFSGSLGSNRYDFWRVAWSEFEAHPVRGIGADNFAAAYLRARHSDEGPRHPHSLAFRLLSQVGLVGTLLWVAFAALLGAAALAARRRPGEAGLVAASLAGFTAWLVHAQVDWLWVFPSVSLLGLGLLALAAALTRAVPAPVDAPPGRPAPGAPPSVGPRARQRPARVALAFVAVAAAVSFALPGAAARLATSAYARFPTDPDGALQRLDRAADLNRLSAQPLVAKGILARRADRIEAARDALHAATKREPSNWFAFFELALLEASAGQWRAAETAVRRARALNPRQPAVRELVRGIARRRPPDAAGIEDRLRDQLQLKLRPTEAD